MNRTLALAVVIGVPILMMFVLSLRRFMHRPTVSGAFPVLGVFAGDGPHARRRALALFPAMGWGQRHSAGHYLDLVSTGLGIAFLVAASLCPLLKRVDYDLSTLARKTDEDAATSSARQDVPRSA